MRNNPFPWITIGVCSALLIPALFMDGMFLDGVFYAAISKNYAGGLGTFWNQYYTATAFPSFHEQPPLLFFLQGLFFKILGGSIYTERIYCLAVALLNVFLVCRCWKIIRPVGKMAWLPVLFWFTMPVTFYVFINNLEECTMSVFVLAAMVHLLRALHTKQRETLHFLLAGAMLLLAGLTKGIQGMFLLSSPFIWWLCVRNNSFLNMLKQSFLVAVIPALFVIYAWFTPVVHDSFQAYFNARYSSTFSHVHDTSASRFHILYELLLDSLCMISMMVIVFVSKRKMSFLTGWNEQKKLILFFALTAATGILPLMITMEQRGFYLVPALPFIAIAAALFVAPQTQRIQERVLRRRTLPVFLSVFGMLVTAGAIISAVFFAGVPKRDADRLHDLKLIAAQTGEGKTLLISGQIMYDWGLRAYAMRLYQISLTEDPAITNEWRIQEKDEAVPAGYQEVVMEVERFRLFRKAR